MSKNELPGSGDWKAVHAAVHRLMKRSDLSIARLSRESGVSETTIRYIGRPEKRQRSTLVALSAALGCQHDYLVDVLRGAVDPGALPRPLADMSMLGSVKHQLDGMTKTLHSIDGKVETILQRADECAIHTGEEGGGGGEATIRSDGI